MRVVNWLNKRLRGLIDAVARFPLTTAFLLAAAIINAYDINLTERHFMNYLLAFVVGAFLSAVAESAYERFFTKGLVRFTLMGIVVLLTAGYYFIIKSAPEYSMSVNIRTGVVLFALLIAFIWIPAIKSKVSFNKSFMISFKAFFIAVFFSGVIFGGVSLIISATDTLIFPIDYKVFSHAANLIFLLFGPLYFLSLIPVYLGKENKDNDEQLKNIRRAANCPKFLEILISYIIVPLIAVFTLILVIYIVQNIGGDFWSDNLLEPMLVSYAITVILVYILASEIENKFAAFFRKVFPKVLVPIVVFQIISSILSLEDTGITHTRYYVILFGIFAAIAGVLLSFLPVRKNGIIAAILIVFAMISVVPPVDAFTISKHNQINILEEVLAKNEMLGNGKIIPNGSISDADKQKITNIVYYLQMMGYMERTEYFPKDFDAYRDFYETFGFKEYYEQTDRNQSVYVHLEPSYPINIAGYDTFIQTDIYSQMQNEGQNEKIAVIEKAGNKYSLLRDFRKDEIDIVLGGENKEELIRFKTKDIYDKFENYHSIKEMITPEEATFTVENEKVKMTIVTQDVSIDKQNGYNNALFYVFVQIK
ncbi:DUF4153 domain-containing protein [Bacillus benzoevorans]|uniref:DUF4153 domain-containing protein n=1 Tax=Bacillus benzoevorans TaxID=1456 RepID=A0A7X0HXV7_9BACI|nr:hypothetical protein [Bacillus benzoevorans]